MNRKMTLAAALAAAISCPLLAHAQSVGIIGDGNPGASGATRNTTGAGARNHTTREDAGAAAGAVGGTVDAIPSTGGRSDGSGVSANTGVTAGGGTMGSSGTTGSTGTTAGASGSSAGATGSAGSVGIGGTSGGAAGGGSAGGGAAAGR